MNVRWQHLAAVVGLLVGVIVVAQAASLLSFLPASNAIAGWALVPGSESQASNRAGITKLYDGAVDEMMGAGITSAAQRIYKKSTKRLTVDIFRFSTAGKAQSYYGKRKGEIASIAGFKKLTTVKQEACYATAGGSTIAYVWCKQYMASISVNGTSPNEVNAVRSFLSSISKKIVAAK